MLGPGDIRLLEDLSTIDDRGLELAEALLHERRQTEEPDGDGTADVHRALLAVSRVRDFTHPRA
jgi:hypothetical protein